MNSYLFIAFFLFVVAFLDALFLFFVLKNNPHNKNLNKTVAVISFTACLYCLFAGIVYTRASMGLSYDFFYRLCWIGWLAIPAYFQCPYYIKDDKSKKALVLGVILYTFWAIVCTLCLTTNWLETGVNSLIPFVGRYGPFEKPVRLLGAFMLVVIIFQLFKTRKEVSGLRKAQLNYFLLGLILYAIGGSLGAGFFQLFKNGFGIDPALVSCFSLPFVALSFYAITRYRLFDIQIIISTSLSVIILTLVLGVLDIGITKFLTPQVGPNLATFIALFVVIIIFLKTPLRRVVQGGINDVFVGDKYNYQAILKDSTQAIITILDQDELLNYLIHAIQQSFKIRKVCLFLKNTQGSLNLRYDWGIDKNIVSQYQLSGDHIIKWLMSTKQIFIKEEQEALMPHEEFNQIYGNLGTIDAQLILPLFFKENLIGFFTLGARYDEQLYVQSDIDVLKTLATQTAIAIENSRLYTEAIRAEELARSNKELEQFAYVASHDLQEPLRMVSSFCQKLEKRYKDKLDADANEYIHFAVDGAKRMQGLIDALLSYARAGKKDVEIKEVDLNKVLQTVLHDLELVIKDNGATIKVGTLPVIMANQIQMAQLFQNFLTNALKFKGERKPVIEITARKEANGWEFVVSDNGIGIDEQHFPKIFEIFQRVHERGVYPGTGIGLALCKKIVENFNGKVWVTSKVGEGTSFYFTLNVKGSTI